MLKFFSSHYECKSRDLVFLNINLLLLVKLALICVTSKSLKQINFRLFYCSNLGLTGCN